MLDTLSYINSSKIETNCTTNKKVIILELNRYEVEEIVKEYGYISCCDAMMIEGYYVKKIN